MSCKQAGGRLWNGLYGHGHADSQSELELVAQRSCAPLYATDYMQKQKGNVAELRPFIGLREEFRLAQTNQFRHSRRQ